MDRPSQDAWDAIFDYLLPRHLARLWTTGDTRVQTKILASRRLDIPIHVGIMSTFCTRVLLNSARSIITSNTGVLVGSSAITNSLIAHSNLKRLDYTNSCHFSATPLMDAPIDLSSLKRLEACHLRDAPFVMEVVLPTSVTAATLPILCKANFSSLTALTALTLATNEGDHVLRAGKQSAIGYSNLEWPPLLLSLEIDISLFVDFEEQSCDAFPPTLTHLAYVGNGTYHVQMKRAIPPQCTALKTIRFSYAWFNDDDADVPLPASLQTLEISWLQLEKERDFDAFIAFVPPHLTKFKVGSFVVHFHTHGMGSTLAQRKQLMERMDVEAVEEYAMNIRNELDYDDDDDDTTKFIEVTKTVLAQRGLDHETYANELVDLHKCTIVCAANRLPPAYAERLINTARRCHGKQLGECEVSEGCDRTMVDNAHFLFARGIATRIALTMTRRSSPPKGVLFNDCIAQRLERISFGADGHWFTEFFSGDLVYPRLRCLIFEHVEHKKAIEALVTVRHKFPLLEDVKFTTYKTGGLTSLAHIRMMACLRLYGFTQPNAYSTWMNYRISPPRFYELQLKGECVDPRLMQRDDINYE